MTQKSIDAIGNYERRFGVEHTHALIAPNYLGDARFLAALEEAVNTGQALTQESAAVRFGPAFVDAVL